MLLVFAYSWCLQQLLWQMQYYGQSLDALHGLDLGSNDRQVEAARSLTIQLGGVGLDQLKQLGFGDEAHLQVERLRPHLDHLLREEQFVDGLEGLELGGERENIEVEELVAL